MSVRWVRVGEVLREADGAVEVEASGLYPIAGVLGHGRGLLARPPLAGAATSYRRLTRIRAGQVIYSRLKAFEGALALVGAEHDGMYVSQEFPTFDLEPGEVDAAWVAHLLQTAWFREAVSARSYGVGARRERLSVGAFLAIWIPLPDLPEQRRIAARLDSIAETAHRVGMDAELLLGGLYSLLLVRDSAREATLREVLAIDDIDVQVDADATYRRVGVRNRGRGVFSQPDLAGSTTAYPRLRIVRAGHVVLSRLKAFEGAVGVAGAEHDGAVVSPEFHTYRVLRPESDEGYVAAALRSPAVWEQLREASTGVGARRERVGAEALLDVRVPMGPPDTRASISRQARHLDVLGALLDRRESLARALLPAARNEEFARLVSS